MGSYITTYDLRSGNPSPYRPFIEEAGEQGLLYVWKSKNRVHRLPNTTLWGRFDGVVAPRSAFERALRAASRRVRYAINDEKRVIVRASEVWVKSGVAKTPEARWTGPTAFRTSRLHQANDPFFAY